MSRDGEIFVGDLVRAIGILRLPPAAWPAIAQQLGLALEDVAPQPRSETPTSRGDEEVVGPGPPAPVTDSRSGDARAPAMPFPAVRPSLLREVEGDLPSPRWLRTARIIPPPGAADGRRASPPPLLRENWTSGVLATILATNDRSGEIDVARVVEELARGRLLEQLPRRPRPTLARGAQVLVDVGDGMLPFSHDVARIVRDVRDVAGGSPLEVLRFAGCASRGAGAGRRSTWKAYAPPSRPRPVLVVSDLGAGRPAGGVERAGPAEWLAFARDLEHARCPVVALVPYPRERIPRTLRRQLRVVPWDRGTSITTVRRALGGVLEAL